MAAISLEYNDNSCPSTPPSSLAPIPVIETPEYPSVVDQLDSIPDGPSLASTLKLPSSNDLLSPTSQSNKPQHPFSLSDLLDGVEGGLEALGPDVAAADITVASKKVIWILLRANVQYFIPLRWRGFHRNVFRCCSPQAKTKI